MDEHFLIGFTDVGPTAQPYNGNPNLFPTSLFYSFSYFMINIIELFDSTERNQIIFTQESVVIENTANIEDGK